MLCLRTRSRVLYPARCRRRASPTLNLSSSGSHKTEHNKKIMSYGRYRTNVFSSVPGRRMRHQRVVSFLQAARRKCSSVHFLSALWLVHFFWSCPCEFVR